MLGPIFLGCTYTLAHFHVCFLSLGGRKWTKNVPLFQCHLGIGLTSSSGSRPPGQPYPLWRRLVARPGFATGTYVDHGDTLGTSRAQNVSSCRSIWQIVYHIWHVFAGGWFTVRAFLCFFWPMGWVGLGWGGLITFNGTSTHTWCYATDLVSCTCTHTWCYATDLVSCTCTHTWCYATDLVSCTCTHTWCYTTNGLGWGGVGWANNDVQWH